MPVYLGSFDHLPALIFHNLRYFPPFFLHFFASFQNDWKHTYKDGEKRRLDTYRQVSKMKKNGFPGLIQPFLLLKPVSQVSEDSYK